MAWRTYCKASDFAVVMAVSRHSPSRSIDSRKRRISHLPLHCHTDPRSPNHQPCDHSDAMGRAHARTLDRSNRIGSSAVRCSGEGCKRTAFPTGPSHRLSLQDAAQPTARTPAAQCIRVLTGYSGVLKALERHSARASTSRALTDLSSRTQTRTADAILGARRCGRCRECAPLSATTSPSTARKWRLFVCLRTYDRPRLGILDSQALELVQAVLARLFRNVSDLRTHGPSYTVCR